MSIYEQLKKRGDWILVQGKTREQVSSGVGHFFARQVTRDAIIRCFDVHDGVIVFVGYMPEGAIEAFEKRRMKLRMDRQERMENYNGRIDHATMVAEHEAKQKALAAAKKEFEEAEDPFAKYDDDYDPENDD